METQSPTVMLRRFDQFLQVSPPCDELRHALRTTIHIPQQSGEAIIIGSDSGPLFRETVDLDQPVLECFLGLLPVVEQTLTTAGYRVVMDFATPVPLPPANVAEVKKAGVCDIAFLEMVRFQDRGLVRHVPSGIDPAWLIAQIALAWPTLSVAVAVTRIDEAGRMRRMLSRYLPNVVAIASRDAAADEQVGRVVVASYIGLGHTGVEVEKRDFVIALNAVEASRPGPLSLFGYARRARMYGLLPLGQLGRLDHDAIRLLFGFEEVTVHRHGVPASQIQVMRFHCAGGTEIPEKHSAAKVKRCGLWNNHVRNRRIARLALQLRSVDRSQFEKDFPFFAEALKGRDKLAVLVLVENLDHGRNLAALLPGWPLIGAGEPKPTARSTGTWILPTSSSDRPMQAIATWQGLPSLNAGGWDVVIRCDGGVGLPPFTDQAGTPIVYGINNSIDPAKPRVLLIDFNDRQHPLLRQWSRQRWRAYLDHGWYSPGVEPAQARINEFIASRPETSVMVENQGKHQGGARNRKVQVSS